MQTIIYKPHIFNKKDKVSKKYIFKIKINN